MPSPEPCHSEWPELLPGAIWARAAAKSHFRVGGPKAIRVWFDVHGFCYHRGPCTWGLVSHLRPCWCPCSATGVILVWVACAATVAIVMSKPTLHPRVMSGAIIPLQLGSVLTSVAQDTTETTVLKPRANLSQSCLSPALPLTGYCNPKAELLVHGRAWLHIQERWPHPSTPQSHLSWPRWHRCSAGSSLHLRRTAPVGLTRALDWPTPASTPSMTWWTVCEGTGYAEPWLQDFHDQGNGGISGSFDEGPVLMMYQREILSQANNLSQQTFKVKWNRQKAILQDAPQAPNATKTNEKVLKRWERWRKEVGLLSKIVLKFPFGRHYSGEEQTPRDWEINGTGLHDVKFPKNQWENYVKKKKTLTVILRNIAFKCIWYVHYIWMNNENLTVCVYIFTYFNYFYSYL